ncbi:MAG: UDP-N-acetylmuramoyl-L-alanine--D-glutamate ligase [Candidatus Nealsonbacteria bacterium]
MKIKDLKNKKILILGFGREGQDTFLFLRKLFPEKVIGIADRQKLKIKRNKVKCHFGKNYLKEIKDYEVIFKAPGIPWKILPKSSFLKITSQTELFFDNYPGIIIGVTGTKGKSTTASMIYQVLKKGEIKAYLAGNIGKPVLGFLSNAKKDDVLVYELSSHQLCGLKKSPHIAVFLNVYPEHLDYYKSFKEYALAKSNIVKYQTKKDSLLYNVKDKIVKKIAEKSKAKKIPIQGKYFELNKDAARKVGKIFKIKKAVIQQALKEFKFLPHRLEFLGSFSGIEFYNDSLSTIPEAVIEALDFLGDKVQTLIVGGFDRGLSFKKLGERIDRNKIDNLVLFPATGKKILKEAKNYKGKHFFVKNMKEAVKIAFLQTKKGKICLLSPASPSFGLFKDYEERGNLFKKFVKEY